MTHTDSNGLARRNFLIGSLAASGAIALGATRTAPSHAHGFPPPIPPDDIPPAPIPLFADSTLTFQCLFAIGATSSGAAEYGEVATAVAAIREAGETYSSYYAQFMALARRVRATAKDAEQHGHRVTARLAYLRAANYFGQALFFVLATDRPTRRHESQVYNAMTRCWRAAGRLMDPPMLAVKLPWRGPNGPMPGWFLRPSADGRPRPTVIVNNGSDAQPIDLWSAGGLAAIERGWNALIFEGPGQGGMLFDRNQHFVPDWERVITPIVTWLRRRSDVDPDRIVLTGSSFGGELVPRAAAFEPRLAAISMDPGVVDAASTWLDNLPPFMIDLFREGKKAQLNADWDDYVRSAPANTQFNIAKRLEIYPGRTFYDQLSQIVQYTNEKVDHRIRVPALVINNEIEQFFPGQARDLYRLLDNSPRRKFRTFTVAEGAQYHCEPMAPQVRNGVVMDFLEDVTGTRRERGRG